MATELELKYNNLYINGVIIGTPDGDLLQRDSIIFQEDSNTQYHTVTQFDRLDLLAYKFYKDLVDDSSKFWWVIADVNNIMNPLDLTDLIGKKIIIPDILRVLIEL